MEKIYGNKINVVAVSNAANTGLFSYIYTWFKYNVYFNHVYCIYIYNILMGVNYHVIGMPIILSYIPTHH